MLLAFDVGNTNIVAGVYDGDRLVQFWRMQTSQTKSADEYGIMLTELFKLENLKTKDVEAVIIASVVPSMLYTLQHLSRKYFNKNALVVGPGIKTGLIIKYDNPRQLGADRIVNSVAALAKYPGPLIVIDYGTATTFCALSDKNEYLGGAIVPGIKIGADALVSRTAALPRIEIESPGKAICRNTTDGMQAGVVYSNVGMTEYIVARMKKEMTECIDSGKKITVVATGGLSTLIAAETDCIDIVDKGLTLTGLQILYEKNKHLAGKAKCNIDQNDEGVY